MFYYPALAVKVIKLSKFTIGRFITEIGGEIERFGSRISSDMAYRQIFSRHRNIGSIEDQEPKISNSYIERNATVLGDVQISEYSKIGHNVVLRAELSPIR